MIGVTADELCNDKSGDDNTVGGDNTVDGGGVDRGSGVSDRVDDEIAPRKPKRGRDRPRKLMIFWFCYRTKKSKIKQKSRLETKINEIYMQKNNQKIK